MDHDDESHESEAKRRRLRKGTRSCWECKRRKVRCTFASETDAICITCRRRGAKCVGQDLPEELGLAEQEDGPDRMMRVEALLDRLVKTVHYSADKEEPLSRVDRGRIPTPASDDGPEDFLSLHAPSLERLRPNSHDARRQRSAPALFTPESQMPVFTRHTASDVGKYEQLSSTLLAAFPSEGDVESIIKASKGIPLFCHKANIMSPRQLEGEDPQNEAMLSKISGPETHPILVAKQMLTLAALLVHFSPREQEQRLSEQPHLIRERLAETSISLVTTNEDLLGTMEALECIVLEGTYHTNCGNIRRAWLAHRRAMGVAQLMGIHRVGGPRIETIISSAITDPQFLWDRIVYMDRFLSMLLALPQGSPDQALELDNSTKSSDVDTQIESLHAKIIARILERNQLGRSPRALVMTQSIDAELLKASTVVPKKLWRPPNFSGLGEDSVERFEENMRVKDQMLHYTLLNQLHLPYLFCPPGGRKSEYSRITCVTASREILTRFIAFRVYNPIPACCRIADFLALVAGMTLIFAHLHSYCHKEESNLLAHQRLGDRATVESALENMEVVSKLNEDMLADKCAKLLQHLLHIENDAALGQKYSAERVQLHDGYHEDNQNALLIAVPYFGTIRIGHEGISSTQAAHRKTQDKQEFGMPITVGGIGSVRVASSIMDQDSPSSRIDPTSLDDNSDYSNHGSATQSQIAQAQTEELDEVLIQNNLPSDLIEDDFLHRQDLYPGLAAGVNDWAFQGVDTAFFDNLMRGSSGQVGDGSEMVDWGRSWDADLGGP